MPGSPRTIALAILSLVWAGCATSSPNPDTLFCGFQGARPERVYWTKISVGPAVLGTAASLGYDWGRLAAAFEYPDFARRAGIEGRVRAEVVVDTTGRVMALRVEPRSDPWLIDSGPHQLLIDAALLGLQRAEFFPAPPFLDAVELDIDFQLR